MLYINYNELDNDEWGNYYWEGKPFTGTAYELYSNNEIASEVEMVEGMANGSVREWYPSGKLKFEGYGKGGSGTAWGREWYENGNLKREIISEYGVRIKETVWDEQGQILLKYERPSADRN